MSLLLALQGAAPITLKRDEALPVEARGTLSRLDTLPVESRGQLVRNESLPVEDLALRRRDESLPVEERASLRRDESLPVEERATLARSESLPVEDLAALRRDESLPVEMQPSVPLLIRDESLPVEIRATLARNESLPVDLVQPGVPGECDDDFASWFQGAVVIQLGDSLDFGSWFQGAPVLEQCLARQFTLLRDERLAVEDLGALARNETLPVEERGSLARDESLPVEFQGAAVGVTLNRDESLPVEHLQAEIEILGFALGPGGAPFVRADVVPVFSQDGHLKTRQKKMPRRKKKGLGYTVQPMPNPQVVVAEAIMARRTPTRRRVFQSERRRLPFVHSTLVLPPQPSEWVPSRLQRDEDELLLLGVL